MDSDKGRIPAVRNRWDIKNVDLLPVARGPLARRLGLAAITRLDQALGSVAEPITPRENAAVPSVERRLLEPIGTAEAIAQVMEDLLSDLAEVLQARGLGVRSLRLSGLLVDGSEQVVAIGTSRPTERFRTCCAC